MIEMHTVFDNVVILFLGIDIRLWKQAQADNPDPEKYFPTPMIGFSEVYDNFKQISQKKSFINNLTNIIIE